MPALIPVIVAAAASYGAGAAITSLAAGTFLTAVSVTGATILSATGMVVAGLVGSVVAYGFTAAFGRALGITPKRQRAPDLSGQAQDRKQSIRQPIGPRQVIYGRARVGGTLVYAASSGEDSRYLHLVSVLATHPVAWIPSIFVNDEEFPFSDLDEKGFVKSGKFAGKVRIKVHRGLQTEADPDLIAESPDGWSADHKLLGCTYIYVRLEYSQELFAGGLQGVGAVVDGKADVWDPRSDTLIWSTNPGLVVLDYLLSPLGMACTLDEIDLPSFIAAANLADEPVTIDAGGATQKRFEINGAFTLEETRREIIARMLSTCGGVLVYVQGRYRLNGAAWTAPTDSLGVSDLAGEVRMTTRPPMRELFNAVKGTFIDPSKFWQAAEFPAVTSAALEAQDGEQLWREIELPFTTNAIHAQRLARIELLRERDAEAIEVPVQYRGIRYAVWQVLSVTLPDLGLSAAPMRVLSWKFTPDAGGLLLTLKRDSASAYAWSHTDATVPAPAPSTTLVSPFVIPAPAGLVASEELYATREGIGLRTRAVAAWSAAQHPFVTGYDVQLLDAAGAVVIRATGTLGETRAVIEDLADGSYRLRVRGRTSLAAGTWAEMPLVIGGLAAMPPAALTGLGIQTIGGMAFLRWDEHPDLDVRIGGAIEIRHTPDTGALAWGGATGIGDAMPGNATSAILPLKPGAYLLRPRDAGGRYAQHFTAITTDAATALSWAALASLTEHPGFSGTRTDTVVVSSTLRLGAGGDVDSEPSWDAIPDLDGLGGVAPSGSYAFSGGIDLGLVKSVRVTGRIRATVVNQLDTIDSRAAPIDEWADFDGIVGGEADAWGEMRTTPDNPAGSPTWSEWRRIDQAEARARGFQFRCQLRSYDPAFNIHVAELSATIDEVV